MDTLRLSTSGNYFSAIQFISHSFYHHANKPKNVSFTSRKPGKSLISAAKDGAELDEWDRMELKFGRMIGEDPKTTLAKIMGRKSNPDLSYLEIEKLLENRKSKAANDEIEELLFDVSEERKSAEPMEGLNLVRPVAKRGNSTDKPVEANDKSHVQPGLNLVRPVLKRGNKFEVSNKPLEATNQSQFQQIVDATKQTKSSVPNVILRKPSSFMEDDGGNGKSTRFGMKPNLSLQMGKEKQKKRFSDITLLRKPEQITNNTDIGDENGRTDLVDSKAGDVDNIGEKSLEYVPVFPKSIDNATLLQKPELFGSLTKGEQDSRKEYTESSSSNVETENNHSQGTKDADPQLDEGTATEFQADTWSIEKPFTPDGASGSNPVVSADMILVGKPKILDLSNKATDQKAGDEVISMAPESLENPLEIENFLSTSPNTEREEDDWDRAEKLVKTGEREEVELISSSTRGFAVLLGSLIGFLPYRNLAARWKFLAFESWLRRKGLDPGIYRQNLGIIGKYDANSIAESSGSGLGSEIKNKPDMAMLSDMKLEDLLMIYDEEKLKFLSSFVGQRINVGVVLADRKSRRLIVSVKPKEKEELVEKKKSLMAQLSVGDVVKCCIKKITYFGIFVEVEGVPALIHQTEVSWDATLDPESYFKIGQIVEAKVHQLDFSLERIFLSLKEITPDPLLEALDAVVGDHDHPLSGALEAAQADTEWADVESLIKELQQFEGIQSVSKGRYFLSPGLAPTFQVYMASMFENQYKLLARAGNRVQEIFVQTSMGKDELKSAIMTCTNRVE